MFENVHDPLKVHHHVPSGTDITTLPDAVFEQGTIEELDGPGSFFYWGEGSQPDLNAHTRLISHVYVADDGGWELEDCDGRTDTMDRGTPIWITRQAPGFGFWEALEQEVLLERELAATAGTGICSRCERGSSTIIPWAGQRLCLSCADHDIDMLALALAEDTAVTVGSGVGGVVTRMGV